MLDASDGGATSPVVKKNWCDYDDDGEVSPKQPSSATARVAVPRTIDPGGRSDKLADQVAPAMVNDEFLQSVGGHQVGGNSPGRQEGTENETIAGSEPGGAKTRQLGASWPVSGYWSINPNAKDYPELYNWDAMIFAKQLERPVRAATNRGVFATVAPNEQIVS